MKEYRQAGIDTALRRAAEIISDRGLAQGVSYDPEDDSLDVVGAIIVAIGGRCASPMYADIHIPQVKVGVFETTLSILEAEIGDVYEWSDSSTIDEVTETLIRISDKVSIAI